MTGILSLAATGALIALGICPLLRIGGLLLAASGLLSTAVTGSPSTALLTVIGAIAWLAGHWLFALRHHYYASSLAQRIFLQIMPPRLDPTRAWGIPNVSSDRR